MTENAGSLKWVDRLLAIIRRVSYVLGLICGGFAFLMTLIIVYDVFMRLFFNAPTIWADEISCYMLIGIAFIGAAYTHTLEGHIRVETLVDRFTSKNRKRLDFATDILSFVFLIIYAWYAIDLVRDSYVNNRITQTLLRTRVYMPQILMALGLVWLCLQFLGRFIETYIIPHSADKN
ncbi:MAG: TRAP transporter small permease [Pseudomonadota bacterium]